MYAYAFHPTLLLRTPVYSYSFYSEQNLCLILKQPFFQKAIYFSSEVFYDELKKSDFELHRLEKKAIDTLKKYFNRMCFRPTPFGICSAFGVVNWSDHDNGIIFAERNVHPHIQLSYAKSAHYAQSLLQVYKNKVTYQLNPTLYKAANEYRFLKQNRDNAQVEFVIDSFKGDSFFTKMLRYLGSGHTTEEISAFVCEKTGCTTDEADAYTQWLIDSQIINSTLEANITGDDHLQSLVKIDTGSFKSVESILNRLQNIRKPTDLDSIRSDNADLKSNDYYVNLEAKFSEGTLGTAYQQQIADALNCLDLLTTNQQPGGLNDFIKNFSQKFEGQTVPLLTAIDPELGVGYSNLAVEENDVNIVNINSPSSATSSNIAWTNVHALLFNKWKTASNGSTLITITDGDLNDIKNTESNLPPTLSVMFRIIGDQVLIETAGGTSACALVGRFTPFDTQIKALACDISGKESEYNPDIIFAEIAHICHDKTANIDRREHIYQYEIPVLVQSTLPKEQQILLNDLWVSVIGGQIILQSKTHNKRVIPRLSSAFNYTRNDLAIFRFLCDLQRASIKTGFNLNMSQLFPGLSFYPRVHYNNTILHLALWNLKNNDFASILKADINSKQTLFKALAQQLNLPRHIALTQNDHQLVFDLDKEDDVLFFLDTIKPLQQFTVKEYPLPSATVIDDNQQIHVNQFITSLYHQQQVYKPIVNIITATKHPRTFIPGSEWLYLKLYCHSIRSNELLYDCVGTIVNKLSRQKLISKWFFIRYADPGYHIRLRLKADLKDHQQILNLLHKTISKYINNGLASNYTIATYEREMERYSHHFMDEFEHTFCTSSNFVSAFLRQHQSMVSAKDILEFAMVSVSDMVVSLGLEGKPLVNFLDRVFSSLANEFSTISDLKYQLDTEYRKHKPVIEVVRQNQDEYYKNLNLNKTRALFIQSLTGLKQSIESKATWRDKWVSDLVHMHLNRLFITDSRKQEMAVYYFLSKYERSAQARATVKPSVKIDN